jgi:hypothetical protein
VLPEAARLIEEAAVKDPHPKVRAAAAELLQENESPAEAQ